MYLKRTVLTIVAVLMTIATANATIVPAIPEPGSGGGGGGYPILIGTNLSQEIDFKGFSMNGKASNWQSGNASFKGNFRLEDGFFNNSFLFAGMKHGFYGNPYESRTLYTMIETSFYSHEGIYNMVKPNTDFELSTYPLLPGVDFNVNSSIHSGNGTSQFPYLFSPYFQHDTHTWITGGIIKAMGMEPSWDIDAEKLYIRFYLSINLTGNLSDIEPFTSFLPNAPNHIIEAFAPVPEPATISILGLGILSLLRKKR